MANEAIPLFRPGLDVTCLTTAGVTGKTFVAPSATVDATEGLAKVATAGAGLKALGVAAFDAASGATVPVICGKGVWVYVACGGTVAAGAEVEVGSAGKAVVLASGRPVGLAISTGANSADILIQLY